MKSYKRTTNLTIKQCSFHLAFGMKYLLHIINWYYFSFSSFYFVAAVRLNYSLLFLLSLCVYVEVRRRSQSVTHLIEFNWAPAKFLSQFQIRKLETSVSVSYVFSVYTVLMFLCACERVCEICECISKFGMRWCILNYNTELWIRIIRLKCDKIRIQF